MLATKYYGRLVLKSDVPKEILKKHPFEEMEAINIKNGKIFCNRCGQMTNKKQGYLPNNNYYCPKCIILGRMSTLQKLVYLPNMKEKFEIPKKVLTWRGELSQYQEKCSNELQTAIKNKQRFLLWAVTGAGKTEMLFKPLERAIKKGLRVAIASPRVDVCNELFPRIDAAFKNVSKILLHGRTDVKYEYTQIVVCTTHQLLKFKSAFDVLIIDEVDSFPYVNDNGLKFAAQKAVKDDGALIYLTATPSHELSQQIKNKQLITSYLPLRFHQQPLPEIKLLFSNNWWQEISEKKQLNRKVIKILKRWAQSENQFLIFVPHVSMLQEVHKVIQKYLSDQVKGKTVHAQDPKRIEKVQMMRDKEIRYLITTTILERGVTFPKIDLLVLGADNEVFSISSLVQIAGRVGRSLERPKGDVYFLCDNYTKTVKKAKQQIIFLNRKAKKMLDSE